jgi:hypothetical protein
MKSILVSYPLLMRRVFIILLLSSVTFSASAVQVTFQVDMTYYRHAGIFNPSTDKVYLKGSFNDWGEGNPMNRIEGTDTFSCSCYLEPLTNYEYKYYINSNGAPNGGMESNVGEADNGNRVIQTDLISFDNALDYYDNKVYSSNPVVLLPNGGEQLKINSSYKIFWSPGSCSKVQLDYSNDGGSSWHLIASNLDASEGNYEWVIPSSLSENCLIKISDQSNSNSSDISNEPFSIIETDIEGKTYVKFTVDMSFQTADGSFNPSTDKVYMRGSFNNWDLSSPMELNREGTYSVTLSLPSDKWFSFKFYTNSKTMADSGWEKKPGIWNEDRVLLIGKNRLDLATVFFNNANMKLQSTSSFFNIYSDDADLEYIDTITTFMNDNCQRITNALEVSNCTKVNLWFFPTQRTYFFYKGYPESPAWSGGGAIGNDNVITFSPRYFNNLDDCLGTATHEFTHSTEACKMSTIIPSWLNEGTAMFYSGDGLIRPIDNIRYIVNELKGGVKPPLSYIEREDFAEGNGYPLSQSITDFIFTVHGPHQLAEFIGNFNYSVLGYSSKDDFQNHWFQHLDKYYLAPQSDIRIFVDMTYYITKGLFNPSTDKVLIGGDFSHWYTFSMLPQGNGIYSFTTSSPYNQTFQYKFKINTPDAANSGWEETVGEGINGSRILNIETKNVTTEPFLFNNLNPLLTLLSPKGGEFLVAGDTVVINWKTTTTPYIKAEYSIDDGNNWNSIKDSISTSSGCTSVKWKVPAETSNMARIRIVSIADQSIVSMSEKIHIVLSNSIGGPYALDNNTVALLHFNNDYINLAKTDYSAIPNIGSGFVNSVNEGLGSGVLIDNSTISKNIMVPHYEELSLTKDWTVELWFYIRSWGSGNVLYPTLINKPGSNYYIYLDPVSKTLSGGFDFNGGTERVNLPANCLQINKWYHIALIKNSSTSRLKCVLHNDQFQLIASQSINYSSAHIPKTNSEPFLLGGYSGGSNCQFDGYADELRISTIAREFRYLKLTSPDKGETLTAGTKITVSWNVQDISNVKLEYSTNGGVNWITIVNTIAASTGTYQWLVPSTLSNNCKIRISDQSDATVNDISDSSFSIIKYVSEDLTVTFSVDLNYQIQNGIFNPSTDKVYLKGSFNGWGQNNQMIQDGATGVYSCTIILDPFSRYQYKYFITSAGAENGGWEFNVSDGENGNRLVNTDNSSIVLPKDYFNNRSVSAKEYCNLTFFNSFPNPFKNSTTIRITIEEDMDASITIVDLYGRDISVVVSGHLTAGEHTFNWSPENVPHGFYLCRFISGKTLKTTKLIYQ